MASPPVFQLSLRGESFTFADLRALLAKANEEKSGDALAGLAAGSYRERVAAKALLAGVTLGYIFEHPAVPYEADFVTRVIQDGVDLAVLARLRDWTVAELREFLVRSDVSPEDRREVSRGLTSEMIAAVCKIMSNLDLIYAAARLPVTARCRTTIGLPGTLSSRLQPNHNTDSPDGILAAIRDGLSYAVGDAVIGINPVDDSVRSVGDVMRHVDDFIHGQLRVPTQTCVLAHVTTQLQAMRKGAPADLIFQSLAGTEKGNRAFGVELPMLEDAQAFMRERCADAARNVLYFETGQGSELSSEAHEGVDQVTLEARCYGLAKRFEPFLVNTVVGFIGPEYLYDAKQVTRAGLEDHFMGKLTGLPMGVDACYTNHADADQNDLENLTVLLTAAGCHYFMGIPLGDDVMLNYQTTSFHDNATLRELFGRRPIAEFETWMEGRGILRDGKLTEVAGDPSVFG